MTENVVTAYVLLNLEIGEESKALENVQKIEDVKRAYNVYGVYRGIAHVESTDMDRLKEVVTWRVRRADKVRSTTTMILSRDSKGLIGFEKNPRQEKLLIVIHRSNKNRFDS